MTDQAPAAPKPVPFERVRVDQIVYARVKVHMTAFDQAGRPSALCLAVDRNGREIPGYPAILPEDGLVTGDELLEAARRPR